jgi:hypothetical protein
MKPAAAARQLEVALSAVSVLSRTGQLDVDPEIDSSGRHPRLGRRLLALPAPGPPTGGTAWGRSASGPSQRDSTTWSEQAAGRRHCAISAASLHEKFARINRT